MLLGLDVGGTFTDAVIIDGHRVVASAKRRTTKDNLMQGIGEALDAILQHFDTTNIDQVTLSTTVVTNTIVEEKEQVVDLFVVTGPGRNVDDIFPVNPVCLQGYTDHRGIVVERTPTNAVRHIAEMVQSRSGTDLAAVSAKFGVRNPQEELSITEALKDRYNTISNGSLLSGSLNFPRRTISAYFNSAVTPVFTVFKKNVEDALSVRNIKAPLHILKADGGSLPMEHMVSRPVETAFTGPAATVLGLSALGAIGNEHTVALDIGGTTTDISLWKQGRPLMTKSGVSIREYPSAVRSFAVTSVGIGGESVVRIVDGEIQIIPYGNAMKSDCNMGANSTEWKAIKPDGTLVAPGTVGTLKIDRTSASDATLRINTSVTTQTTESNDTSVPFKDTKAVSGVTIPQILIASGLYPDAGQTTPGRFWARNNGERLPFRGSGFYNTSYGGAGALSLFYARSSVHYGVSLRSALVE